VDIVAGGKNEANEQVPVQSVGHYDPDRRRGTGMGVVRMAGIAAPVDRQDTRTGLHDPFGIGGVVPARAGRFHPL